MAFPIGAVLAGAGVVKGLLGKKKSAAGGPNGSALFAALIKKKRLEDDLQRLRASTGPQGGSR